jgi:hypothetical protein
MWFSLSCRKSHCSVQYGCQSSFSFLTSKLQHRLIFSRKCYMIPAITISLDIHFFSFSLLCLLDKFITFISDAFLFIYLFFFLNQNQLITVNQTGLLWNIRFCVCAVLLTPTGTTVLCIYIYIKSNLSYKTVLT